MQTRPQQPLTERSPHGGRLEADDQYDLVRSFLIAAIVIVTLGMAGIGYWVTDRIEDAASRNAATVAALYVDGVAAPLTQALLGGPGELQAVEALDDRLRRGLMDDDLFAFKVWRPDGVIAYASDRRQIGMRFPIEDGLRTALNGRVHTEWDDLSDAEALREGSPDLSLLEVYSPIRNPATGDVIGVFEFYDRAPQLRQEIVSARIESWLLVGAITVVMVSLLSGVIMRGGRLISRQRAALGRQIQELGELLEQNRQLSSRVSQANRRVSEFNERQLRRISAEIHDGPLQLLAFASLRLDASKMRNAEPVREALDQALVELRQISRGLTLPELEGLSAEQVVRRAVVAHEGRTGQVAAFRCDDGLRAVTQAERICMYRVVQEGLNNVARHAPGATAGVDLRHDGDRLVLRVRDDGPGFDPASDTEGLGLRGLRDRIESLGGTFHVETAPGRGVTLTACLPHEAA